MTSVRVFRIGVVAVFAASVLSCVPLDDGGGDCSAPPQTVNTVSISGTLDDEPFSFAVTGIESSPLRLDGRDQQSSFGTVEFVLRGGEGDNGDDVVLIVAVSEGSRGTAVVDLRGVTGPGTYAIEPGRVGLSLTGDPAGAATDGTFTLDDDGLHFDVTFDGGHAIGTIEFSAVQETQCA